MEEGNHSKLPLYLSYSDKKPILVKMLSRVLKIILAARLFKGEGL